MEGSQDLSKALNSYIWILTKSNMQGNFKKMTSTTAKQVMSFMFCVSF